MLQIQTHLVSDLKPYANNARVHSKKQIAQIARSIKIFGFNNPILIDKNKKVIAGHGRLLAAIELGMAEVPTICLDHMTEAQKRAYTLLLLYASLRALQRRPHLLQCYAFQSRIMACYWTTHLQTI